MTFNLFSRAIAGLFVVALVACNQPPAETPATTEPAASSETAASTDTPAMTTPASEGGMCGGIAGIPCGEGLYCAFADGMCKTADAAGSCQVVPNACTLDYAPVCGCDGKTYSNRCAAAAAAVSVEAEGECAAPATP